MSTDTVCSAMLALALASTELLPPRSSVLAGFQLAASAGPMCEDARVSVHHGGFQGSQTRVLSVIAFESLHRLISGGICLIYKLVYVFESYKWGDPYLTTRKQSLVAWKYI